MKIKELTSYLESIAPTSYQESYDNVGLIVGNPDEEIQGALICLDSTEEVIEEAITKGCNLVVAHHPIIFKGLKKLNGHTYVERVVIKAIRHGIAIYAIHTNLDNVYYQGVNARIAEKIGLVNTQILAPKEEQTIGSGMIGELPGPADETTFLHHLKKAMKTGCIRHTKLLGRKVKRIALCGGSGSFLLGRAIAEKADVFITADFKYHEFFDADEKILIADIGHYESEQFTIELLYEIITKKFRNFAAHYTKVNTNPVNYLC